MAVTDVSVLKKKRRQKKIMRFLKKLIIILLIAAAALAVVLTKDLWYPKLDGILTKIPSAENSPELAKGSFPISIDGGADYQLEIMDNAAAIIDDSHFFVYNFNGEQIFTEQHTMANPIMTVSAKKALIYDLGGNTFSLMSKHKTIYSKSTESAILLARLSENDCAAVVTKDEKFISKLMIYDSGGKNIFNYGSVERIIDVTFDKENSGCYITAVGSEDGVIVSRILYYKFDGINYDGSGNPVPEWESEPVETLAISVRPYGDGNIIVFGDNLCAYYNTGGALINAVKYKYSLVGYDSGGSIAAMIFNDSELRRSHLITIDCTTGEIVEKKLDCTAANIQVYDGIVFVQYRGGISAFTPSGEESASVKLDSDYDDFRRVNGYIFLMGYDEINRINFN